MTTLWSQEEKVFFLFSYYDHYAMIKRKKLFFSFSYDDHYAMMKREESFSHLGTMFTNEERKTVFFIYSLRSLCHHQEQKFFFHLATTITTLWSRDKNCFFSFTYYDHYAMIKREESAFIYSLGLLRHDEEKKLFFFHLATTITRPWWRGKKFFFI